VRYWPLHGREFLVRQSRKGSSSLMNSLGWLRLALGSPRRSCFPWCYLSHETLRALLPPRRAFALCHSFYRLVALMQQRETLPACYRGVIVRGDAFHFGPVGSLLVPRVAQDHSLVVKDVQVAPLSSIPWHRLSLHWQRIWHLSRGRADLPAFAAAIDSGSPTDAHNSTCDSGNGGDRDGIANRHGCLPFRRTIFPTCSPRTSGEPECQPQDDQERLVGIVERAARRGKRGWHASCCPWLVRDRSRQAWAVTTPSAADSAAWRKRGHRTRHSQVMKQPQVPSCCLLSGCHSAPPKKPSSIQMGLYPRSRTKRKAVAQRS
jgi:hypothetical protein